MSTLSIIANLAKLFLSMTHLPRSVFIAPDDPTPTYSLLPDHDISMHHLDILLSRGLKLVLSFHIFFLVWRYHRIPCVVSSLFVFFYLIERFNQPVNLRLARWAAHNYINNIFQWIEYLKINCAIKKRNRETTQVSLIKGAEVAEVCLHLHHLGSINYSHLNCFRYTTRSSSFLLQLPCTYFWWFRLAVQSWMWCINPPQMFIAVIAGGQFQNCPSIAVLPPGTIC